MSTFILSLLYYAILISVVTSEGENLIGSSLVLDERYAYTVQVEAEHEKCTGSIISTSHVITAGHCVMDSQNEILKSTLIGVVARSNDLKSPDSSTRVFLTVARIYAVKVDANADSRFYTEDIVVLKLKTNFNFETDSYVKKLNLPMKSVPKINDQAVITGFGVNRIKVTHSQNTKVYKRNYDGKLRYANTMIVDISNCANMMKSMGVEYSDRHFCAMILPEQSDTISSTCNGDSGGPLVKDDQLMGVLTIGATNCDSFMSVYVNTTTYIDFIHKALNDIPDTRIICRELTRQGQAPCRVQ